MKRALAALLLAVLVFMPQVILAYVIADDCANCHTDRWEAKEEGRSVVAITDAQVCVDCHSSDTTPTYYNLGENKVPVVLYKGNSAPASYLAGGNFWWVKEDLGGDDTKGHNVFLGEDDANLSEAPGRIGGCENSCHTRLSEKSMCDDLGEGLSGKYGCQGCHLHVKHHANDHPNGKPGLVTNAEQGWYRFLSGHDFTGKGVKGYEDGLWEAGLHDGKDHQGAIQHNEYIGAPRATGYGFSQNGGAGDGVTAFCTGCHGEFGHGGQDSSGAWVRHPSDALIPNSGEYQYIGGLEYLYDPLSPVARPGVSELAAEPEHVRPGVDVVMCLSCHRPHGSPYPDLLRWNYEEQLAGRGKNDKGCFYCHTKKNR